MLQILKFIFHTFNQLYKITEYIKMKLLNTFINEKTRIMEKIR
jgi:hypothetical protein